MRERVLIATKVQGQHFATRQDDLHEGPRLELRGFPAKALAESDSCRQENEQPGRTQLSALAPDTEWIR